MTDKKVTLEYVQDVSADSGRPSLFQLKILGSGKGAGSWRRSIVTSVSPSSILTLRFFCNLGGPTFQIFLYSLSQLIS